MAEDIVYFAYQGKQYSVSVIESHGHSRHGESDTYQV